jgi:dTMP kinase
VILDRYYDSTTAYQGYGRKVVRIDDINAINRIASNGREPDITFYLRLDFESSLRRTSHLFKDRMEQAGQEFFLNVIEGFDEIAKSNPRVVTIDASADIGQIHDEIMSVTMKVL